MRLLEQEPSETADMLEKMSIERKQINKEIFDIAWFMRGGITLEQAWQLNSKQRKIVHKRIKENVEQTEKTGLPLI